MRCFARRRPGNPQRQRRPRGGAATVASVSAGLSRERTAGANATTRSDRESTMPLASNAADRTSGVSDGAARRVPRPSRNSRSEGRMVEPALYTVEGRQAADLRQKCDSALIRKAKLPARSCGRPSFWQGWPTRRIGRPRHEGGGSCVASW
jgi:hypothetical protein